MKTRAVFIYTEITGACRNTKPGNKMDILNTQVQIMVA